MTRKDEKLIEQRTNKILIEVIEEGFRKLVLDGMASRGTEKLGFQLLKQMVTEMVAKEVVNKSACGGIYRNLSDFLNSINYVLEHSNGELEYVEEEHLKVALEWLRDNSFIDISTDNPDDWDYDTWALISDWPNQAHV